MHMHTSHHQVDDKSKGQAPGGNSSCWSPAERQLPSSTSAASSSVMSSSVCVTSSSNLVFADEVGALGAAGVAGSAASGANDGRTVGVASATEGAGGAAGGAASVVGSSNIWARSAGSAGSEVMGGAGGAAAKAAAADGAGPASSASSSVICSRISVTTSSPHNSPLQLAGGQGATEGVRVADVGAVRGQDGAASAREVGAADDGMVPDT